MIKHRQIKGCKEWCGLPFWYKEETVAKYQAIYKCRLCGKLFNGVAISSERIALETTTDACLGIKNEVICAPQIREVHLCADGSYGVADFLGRKKMNSPK